METRGFDDDEKSQKRNDDEKPRGGRRGRVRNEEPQEEASEKVEETRQQDKEEANGPGPSGKSRRRRAGDDEETTTTTTAAAPSKSGGGWMDSTASKPVQNEDDIASLEDTSSAPKSKHFGKDKEEDDEILVIPDLDEEAGTDADHRVAHAPRNLNRKVPSRIELENSVKASVPSVEDGFDLAVLLGTLVPHDMVVEEDEPWTFATLLREVTEEINASNSKIPVAAPVVEAPLRVRSEVTTKG